MIVLYLLFAMDMLNLTLLLPIQSSQVILLGGSHKTLGIITTVSAFISLIWKPAAGSLSDRKGSSQILKVCFIFCLIGNIIIYTFNSLNGFYLGRILCAFGSPNQLLLRNILTDMLHKSKSESEASASNKIGVIMSVCFMGGALASGLLSEYKDGISYIYGLISVNLIFALFLANMLPVESKSKVAQEPTGTKLNEVHIDWTKYWDIMLLKLAIELSFGIMQINMGFVLLSLFNVEGRQMGYVFSLISIVSITTNIVMLRLNKIYNINEKSYALCGTISLLFSYIGLGLASTFSIFACFMATLSISRTLLDANIYILLNSRCNEKDKGKITGVFDSIVSLAELVGPIISTISASIYGEQFSVLLCSIPTFIGTMIVYRL